MILVDMFGVASDPTFTSNNPYNPCLNGGACTNGPGRQWSCACTPGFDGDYCEIDSECSLS